MHRENTQTPQLTRRVEPQTSKMQALVILPNVISVLHRCYMDNTPNCTWLSYFVVRSTLGFSTTVQLSEWACRYLCWLHQTSLTWSFLTLLCLATRAVMSWGCIYNKLSLLDLFLKWMHGIGARLASSTHGWFSAVFWSHLFLIKEILSNTMHNTSITSDQLETETEHSETTFSYENMKTKNCRLTSQTQISELILISSKNKMKLSNKNTCRFVWNVYFS